MSETQNFEGTCHCGKVKYTVEMAPPEKAFACNCSICSRAGWLLAFAPADTFVLHADPADLADYQFHKHHIHHWFCKTCGIRPFSRGAGKDGKEMVSINLRCVAGVDLAKLPVETFDGASL